MNKKVKILKALANEKRLEILDLLKKQKFSSSEIAYQINLHFKSTSKHLHRLADAGLIQADRSGVWMIYQFTRETEKIIVSIDQIK